MAVTGCTAAIQMMSSEYVFFGKVGFFNARLDCQTRNLHAAGLNLTAGHLQATLSKLLTYGVLRSTQPPTLHGTGMSNRL